MSSFRDIINSVVDFPELFTVGTVAAVDEATYSCDVQPDDGGPLVKDVPLRVRRDNNKIGVTIVPALNTPIIIMWVDTQRPTVFQVQKWAKVIIQDESGLGFVITASDKIKAGIEDRAIHPVAWGDAVASYFSKIHTAITGLHGTLDEPPNVESGEVFTS